MADKFPIIAVTKEALSLPLRAPVDILKALGLIILSGFVGGIVLGILLVIGGVDFGNLNNLQQSFETGDFSAISDLGTILLGYLGLIVVVVLAAAHIFNYWVRLGAFGPDAAKIRPFGRALKLAAINMLKFIFIGILLTIAVLVLQFVLSSVGLAPSFSDQLAANSSGDITSSVTDGLLTTVLSTVLYCLIYSFFSANLTQTAMDTDAEGFEHPHTIDFAIVLMLIYLVVLVPTILASLAGSLWLVFLIQFLLGIYVSFAIGAAHGLRYRFCVPSEREAFE